MVKNTGGFGYFAMIVIDRTNQTIETNYDKRGRFDNYRLLDNQAKYNRITEALKQARELEAEAKMLYESMPEIC